MSGGKENITKTFLNGSFALVEVAEYFQGLGVDVTKGTFIIKFRFPGPEYPDNIETDVTYEPPEY